LNFIDLNGLLSYTFAILLGVNVDLIPRGEIRRELRERILSEAVAVMTRDLLLYISDIIENMRDAGAIYWFQDV